MDTEKTEITSMQDGMSSEDIDALTTGEEQEKPEVLAQEATEQESPPAEESVKDETKPKETEETPVEEPEPELSETEQQLRAKDSKIASMKHQNRELEIERARLEGELEARKSLQTPEEKPKSPLEIAEAAYLEINGTLEGFSMDGELYRKQRAFDDEQEAKQTAATEQEKKKTAMDRAVKSLQADELSVEKMGAGLDFNSVVGLGQHYLDKADMMKIEIVTNRDGVDAGVRKAYELCKAAILAANNSDSRLLQNAIESKSQPKPKKQTDIDALTTEGEDADTGEAEEDTHSQRLTDFIFG